jgi:hypothetical protein
MTKWFGRKRSWTNFKVLSRHSHEEAKENHEKSQSEKLLAGAKNRAGLRAEI